MKPKYLTFKVQVPAYGIDGKRLKSSEVKEYIRDAVSNWSGQFSPDEDNMFYWCGDGKTKVTQLRPKKLP